MNGRTSLVNESDEDASMHTHYTPSPPPQKKKQKTKQKKISVFKNGIIECATVSHSAGLFGFLEILF